MKFTSITYARGATINRGNYNSERYDISATVEIDPGEPEDFAYGRLAEWVRAKLARELKNGKPEDGKP